MTEEGMKITVFIQYLILLIWSCSSGEYSIYCL